MESIKSFLNECLPSQTNETIEALLSNLLEAGVETFSDLKYVDPTKDFASLLKPIPIRKLKEKIDSTFKSVSEPAPAALDSINTCDTAENDVAVSSMCSTASECYTIVELPLQKFPAMAMKKIKKGERPTPAERREIIRIISAGIIDVTPKPLKKHIEPVAKKLVEKFPSSFRDSVGSTTVGNGYAGVLGQLIARIENIRRTPNTSVKRLCTVTSEAECSSKRRTVDKYGCVDFQPDAFPDDENMISQNDKKQWLISEFSKEIRDMELISKYMDITYVSQRLVINSKSQITYIRSEWPFLMEKQFCLKHANRLLGFCLESKYSLSLDNKVPELVNYFKSSECFKTFQDFDFSKQMETTFVKMLCLYFKEEEERIIQIFDENTSLDDVLDEGSAAPRIICIGDPYTMNSVCTVVVEKVALEAMLPINDAILLWFSSFYVFNIQYPTESAATLEFIQRVFLDINPQDKGAKSEKRIGKRVPVHPKVLKLANKLKDYTSPWNIRQ